MGAFFDYIAPPSSRWQGLESDRRSLVRRWKSNRRSWRVCAFCWRVLGLGIFRLDRWAGCDEGIKTGNDFLRYLGAYDER